MFRPMLAETADLERISYPVLAQPKFDGIRCIVLPDLGPVTRTLKPVPNAFIRSKLERFMYFDGEIVTYSADGPDSLDVVQSKVMRADGSPPFRFHAFDHVEALTLPYEERVKRLWQDKEKCVEPVSGVAISSFEELHLYEGDLVSQGWEGVILRKPGSAYKCGRSTVREGTLLKMKRFRDAEAVIKGVREKMSNSNALQRDERGYAKRSGTKSGLIPAGVMGALQMDWNGIEFELGTGFDEDLRKHVWENIPAYLGRKVTFKYQRTGPNGKPLLPVFKSFRDPRDHDDLI